MKTAQCERCGTDVEYGWMLFDPFYIFFPLPVHIKKPRYCHDCQLTLDIRASREAEVIRQQKISEWERNSPVAKHQQKREAD